MLDTRKWTLVGLLALVFSILLVPTAFGQETTVQVEAKWDPPPPDSGSDPALYRIEYRFRLNKQAPPGFWGEIGTSSEPAYILTLEKGLCYEVRVRAQDDAGHLGPYSVLSEEFCIPEDESGEAGTDKEPLPPEDIEGPYKQGE